LARRKFIDWAEEVEVCHFRYEALCLGQSQAEDYLELPQARPTVEQAKSRAARSQHLRIG
jgi:hypothetical protein